MAPHSSTLAWKILWMEEPGRLQSMGSLRVRHDWATSLSLFTFMHWRRKWQPTPVFSCLENPRDGGAWWAAVYGVTQSRTWLKWRSSLAAHASKVMLKILQARLQQYVNCELSDVQAGFRKGRETRDQIANIRWIIEKAREFQKNIYFCFITMPKPLTVWITINCGKFWKRWEYQTTRPASWETYMQISKQQLELDMEQQTGSK